MDDSHTEPDRAAPAEIEITPAMIEAGVRVFWRHPNADDPSERELEEVLSAVYAAMFEAWRKSCSKD